jgi:two-component system OmpR family response regulator
LNRRAQTPPRTLDRNFDRHIVAQILVVEDDTETAALIRTALEAEHHTVVHLADGRTALDRLAAERFDAATVDRMLPGLDGLTLVARMRARQITTPVLVISALGDVDERIAGLRAGGDDYLAKPFSLPKWSPASKSCRAARATIPKTGSCAPALELDLVKRKAWVMGEAVELLNKEFRLLEFRCAMPDTSLPDRSFSNKSGAAISKRATISSTCTSPACAANWNVPTGPPRSRRSRAKAIDWPFLTRMHKTGRCLTPNPLHHALNPSRPGPRCTTHRRATPARSG